MKLQIERATNIGGEEEEKKQRRDNQPEAVRSCSASRGLERTAPETFILQAIKTNNELSLNKLPRDRENPRSNAQKSHQPTK